MEHFKFRSPVPLRSQRTATACFSTLGCFSADLHLKWDDTPNAIERTKSAQEIFNAKDGRKGPKRSRRRINFPKVCRWRLKAQTTKTAWTRILWPCSLPARPGHEGGTDGRQKLSPCEEKWSWASSTHDKSYLCWRLLAAVPAPRLRADMRWGGAGAEARPRWQYDTLGAEALQLAAYPLFCKEANPAAFERVKVLEEATACHRKVRNIARSHASGRWKGKAPTFFLWGSAIPRRAGGGAPRHPASRGSRSHPRRTRQGKLRQLLCTHTCSNCFLVFRLNACFFSPVVLFFF